MTLLTSLIQAILAQDGKNKTSACRVRIQVVGFNWENPSSTTPDSLSYNQLRWWLKDGQKKFPKVCLTTSHEKADYVFYWAETVETSTYTYRAPKVESTTQHRGTINTTTTSTSNPGNGANTTGTYNGTSTKTTYEDKQTEQSTWHVRAALRKMTEVDGKKQPEKIPLFVTRHEGNWRWSKPDKDALEKAVKFIDKQVK